MANHSPSRSPGAVDFEDAYRRWAQTKLEMELWECSDRDQSDEDIDAVFARQVTAIWQLCQAKAYGLRHVRLRADVLRHECQRACEAGLPNDKRLSMLAQALYFDLQALSLDASEDLEVA